MRRAAITGVGLVTPLGTGTEATWRGLLEGRSAVGPIQSYDASSLRTRIGGEVSDLDGAQFVAKRRALRTMTRSDLMAVAGATLAVQDAGVEVTEKNAARCGLFVGSNKEVSDVEKMIDGLVVARDEQGRLEPRRFGAEAISSVYPLFFIEGLQAAALFHVSERFGLKGVNTYFAGTAESGATAIGRAFRAVRRGEADVAIAGGYDDAVAWWPMSKMDAVGLMTQRNDLGAAACRPFDAAREGTVMGEGAAMLVLEDLDAAVARGARIYAEVIGFGSTFDDARLVTPDPEGRAVARAIAAALREAGARPDEIGYVAAHASGTRLGDASEGHALRAAFGTDDGPVVSSVKAATGDLSAGAGALNVAVAALAVHERTAPPNLNLDDPDPECGPADRLIREAREFEAPRAVAVARGFTGQNVALTVQAV